MGCPVEELEVDPMSESEESGMPAGGLAGLVEVTEDASLPTQFQIAHRASEYKLPTLEYKLKTIDHFDECFELATAEYKDPGNQMLRHVRVKRCKFGDLSPWVPVDKNDIKRGDKIRYVPKKQTRRGQPMLLALTIFRIYDSIITSIYSYLLFLLQRTRSTSQLRYYSFSTGAHRVEKVKDDLLNVKDEFQLL